jgi:pimeloyl-ACP methyl ester carboxylesterase
MSMWESQVAHFKEDRYRVLTVDLPEHGGSKDTVLPAYSMKQCRRVMAAAFRYESGKKLENIKNKTLILIAEDNRQTHRQGRKMQGLIKKTRN